MKRVAAAGLLLAGLAAGCGPAARSAARGQPSPVAPPVRFRNVTGESGVGFRLGPNDPAQLTIAPMSAGGAGLLDLDSDGDLDLLLLGFGRTAFYRNEGESRFVDVTAAVLPGPAAAWMGCAAGDYDGDGRVDLFLSGYHCARLYRNAGGRFVDRTRGSGIVADRWFTSAAFADVDGDGDLDLYAGGYVRFGPASPQHCPVGVDAAGKAVTGPCGPEPYPALPGKLWVNEGGRFRDVTRAAGLEHATGKTLGVAFGDYDDDGDPDLYLANDRMPGDLFRNAGEPGGIPRFRNVAAAAGTAYNRDGEVQGGMGVDWGDYDGDGRLDLFVATYQGEPKSLYRNEGRGLFREVSAGAGLAPAQPFVAFGARFADFDNDGWLDLFLANGHVLGPVEKVDPTLSYPQPLQLFHSRGDGTFQEVAAQAGAALATRIVGRGAATGDWDNDGRVDLVAVDLEGSPVLLHNETENQNHWLRVRLDGAGDNRQGIGARATLRVPGAAHTQLRQATAGGSYLAASDPRLLFGLGDAGAGLELVVRWPSGATSRVRPAGVDREVVVREAETP
jgi:hypothetical protein